MTPGLTYDATRVIPYQRTSGPIIATPYGAFSELSGGATFGPLLFGLSTNSEITVAWVQRPNGTSGYSGVVSIPVSQSSTTFGIYSSDGPNAYAICAGLSSSAAGATFSSGSGGFYGGNVNGVIDDFVYSTPALSATYSSHLMFRNGVKYSSPTSVPFGAFSTSNVLVGTFPSGDLWEGMIGAVVIWNRLISDDEVGQYRENRWQIYAPANSPVFYSLPSGAVTTSYPLSRAFRAQQHLLIR